MLGDEIHPPPASANRAQPVPHATCPGWRGSAFRGDPAGSSPAGNAMVSAASTHTCGEDRRIAEGWRIGKLLGAAELLLEAASQVFEPAKRHHYEQTLSTARELLGDDVYEAARSAGQAMTIEQAIAYVQNESVPDGQ